MNDTLEDIRNFDFTPDVNDTFDLQIESISSHFFSIGEPVPAENRDYLGKTVFSHFANASSDNSFAGDAIKKLCPAGVSFRYLISGEESFRAQVADIMESHDIEYDDVYQSFFDVYEALFNLDMGAFQSAVKAYQEILAIFPSGTYQSQSPKGVGWSLNIDWESAEAEVSWNGSLL